MTTALRTGYAPVNGLQMYYEIHGEGEPLVLLHGGVGASEMLGPNLAELAKTRQVITPHMQGHGRTRDVDRPFRLETMADDVAALMEYLAIEQADFLGYSMGGGVALQTAIRHPNAVRKLVVVAMTFKRDGSYPEVLAAFDQMAPNAALIAQSMKQSPLSELYPEADWEAIFSKIGDMGTQDYDWSDDVAAITSPTMLIFADADSMRPEHMVEFYRLLGGGQRDAGLDGSLRSAARLAIIPGTTHYDIMATTTVAEMVLPFLDTPLP
jgi:pimeloyl-ACP methyl ester carboxylesterase